jgi:hypothetical protein
MAYVSVDSLRRYLGISSTNDDVLLAELIAAAQAIIDGYTGRTFEASTDTTRYHDATRDVEGWLLWLDGDLCQVTSVVNGDGVTVASNERVTEPRRATPYYAIRLLDSSGKAWEYDTDEENAIAVTGRWAYSLTAPADVAQACKRLAAYMYRQKDNANDLDRAVVVGNATVLPSDLPSDIVKLLAPYKRMTV